MENFVWGSLTRELLIWGRFRDLGSRKGESRELDPNLESNRIIFTRIGSSKVESDFENPNSDRIRISLFSKTRIRIGSGFDFFFKPELESDQPPFGIVEFESV